MRLQCYECGKSVSTEVPPETVVRAALFCPECIEVMATDGRLRLRDDTAAEERGGTGMSDWRNDMDAAMVDVTAARLSSDKEQALEHLRDALTNIEKAIEALEEEIGEEED